MVNNYVKISNRFHFFNDRDRLQRVVALGFAQSTKTSAVYRRPDLLWREVREIGDGIGALAEPWDGVVQ